MDRAKTAVCLCWPAQKITAIFPLQSSTRGISSPKRTAHQHSVAFDTSNSSCAFERVSFLDLSRIDHNDYPHLVPLPVPRGGPGSTHHGVWHPSSTMTIVHATRPRSCAGKTGILSLSLAHQQKSWLAAFLHIRIPRKRVTCPALSGSAT